MLITVERAVEQITIAVRSGPIGGTAALFITSGTPEQWLAGAKYFEFQHTPTQAARVSDEDLEMILTMGKKPEGVGFRILPEMLGGMTAEELYADFHTWTATEDEIKGLIIYLRSLTPTGQGDIRLPDGTYVAPGEPPPNLPMP